MMRYFLKLALWTATVVCSQQVLSGHDLASQKSYCRKCGLRSAHCALMSLKAVSEQCGKRMLLRALCPVQLGYDMA